jgi:2-hydroxychromene-2-carboxylate isomerase
MLAMAALLVAGQATVQDITLNSVARSVSLINAIYNCGRYYPVDTALLERADAALNEVGEKAAAKEGKNWRAILQAEIERRHQEVVATGLQQWCSYQRQRPDSRQFFKRKG